MGLIIKVEYALALVDKSRPISVEYTAEFKVHLVNTSSSSSSIYSSVKNKNIRMSYTAVDESFVSENRSISRKAATFYSFVQLCLLIPCSVRIIRFQYLV